MERKQFLSETAHSKLWGLSRVTGSRFLQRAISVEFFKDIFCRFKQHVVHLYSWHLQTVHLTPKQSGWINNTTGKKVPPFSTVIRSTMHQENAVLRCFEGDFVALWRSDLWLSAIWIANYSTAYIVNDYLTLKRAEETDLLSRVRTNWGRVKETTCTTKLFYTSAWPS